MLSISRAWKVLTRRERLSVIFSAAIRLALVALDILGVLFIGIAVALASGTTTAPTSATGQILAYLEQLNLGNPYALVAGASLGFFILKGILAILLNSQIARFFSNLESKKSAYLYEKILFGSLDVKERWTNKELVHGLIPGMQTAFGSTLIHASAVLGEVFMVVGIAVFLGFKDLYLFIATAIFFASIGFVMHRLISKQSTALGVEGTQLLLQATTMADDSLNAIRTIRSGKNKYLFVNKFAELRINLARTAGRMTIVSILPRYITEIALMIAAGGLIAQRSVFGENAIPADTIAVFLAGAFRIVASMLTLQGSLSAIGHASGVTQVTFDLLDEYQETENDVKVASNPSNSREVLHLKNVSFSYSGSDRPAVRGANLRLMSGDYLAIVGASGQGKSTLLDLLMGLRQPSSGQITLGGKSPVTFSRESPGSVAYLSQKVPIFPGTISQNVALEFEPEKINRKRVFETLADSELLDWVQSLPDGVETTISSDTRALSGGEAQRLGLARILYQNPTLLLLDEPTSALDSKTAQSVMATIEKLKGKTTILLITHSLEATRGANKFARMRDGTLEMLEGPEIS